MKKIFKPFACILALSLLFVCCEKPDNPGQKEQEKEQEKHDDNPSGGGEEEKYGGIGRVEGDIVLDINGRSVQGCAAKYEPAGEKYTLTITGETINILEEMAKVFDIKASGKDYELTANVVPGQKTLNLEISPVEDGGQDSFSGNATQKYCTFGYQGKASTNSLKLNLTDLKVSTAPIVGTKWNLVAPTDRMEDMIIVEGDEKFTNMAKTLENLMNTLANLLPESNGIQYIIADVLKGIACYEDGMATATLSFDDSQGNESPKGLFDYVPTESREKGKYALVAHPNAGDFIRYLSGDISIEDETLAKVTPLVEATLEQVCDYMVMTAEKGVAFDYVINGNTLEICFGTETVKDFLGLVHSVFSVNGIENSLTDLIVYIAEISEKDARSALLLANPVIKNIPNIINQVKSAQVGLRFTAAK